MENRGRVNAMAAENPASVEREHAAVELLDYCAAAELLHVPVSSLRRYVMTGRVPHLRYGPRTVRFRRAELLAWMESKAVAPSEGRR